jgi:CheY-like chemotaxis protein
LFNVVQHEGVKSVRIEVCQMDVCKPEASARLGQENILSYTGGNVRIDCAPGGEGRFKATVPKSGDAGNGYALHERPSESSAGPSPQPRIRIVLVDDHIVMRQGLARLLRLEPEFEIIGEASDGESAVKFIRDVRPDVVLMDISMPGMDGIEATRIIHSELPEICVIGLSMFEGEGHAALMREAGAVNYLTKSGPAEAVIDAIRDCARRA